MADRTEEYDCVVFGSGLAGMVAALTARLLGLEVALCEKDAQLGGTLATAGGAVWIPGNSQSRKAGRPDIDDARLYLETVTPKEVPAANRDAFLSAGQEALDFLESRSEVKYKANNPYPDYRPDTPGAATGYRTLSPLPFDGTLLGDDFGLVRPPMPEFMILGGLMVARDQIPHLVRPWGSVRSFTLAARIVARYLRDRLTAPRGRMLYLGNATVARCLYSMRRAGVTILTKTALVDLVREGGRVAGATVRHDGKVRTIGARRGVVLATGGFSASADLRAELMTGLGIAETLTVDGDGGDGLRAAQGAGAALDRGHASPAFWMPVSTLTRRDGTKAVYPHIRDRPKPGLIAVNSQGRRFVNEADSYHDFSMAVFRENAANPGNRTWLICDRRFIREYGIGMIHPVWQSLGHYVRSGYLVEGATLAALAAKIGVDPGAFEETVARHNRFAATGIDEDFGKGSNALNRYNGDPDNKPNPCLAPIETAPFFALRVSPAPIGTSVGLATDGDGRVLDAGGAAVPGLFAVGSDMSSIMGGTYPGPGIALGPGLVFGYRAAKRLAGGAT